MKRTGGLLALDYQFHASIREQAICEAAPIMKNMKMFGELRLVQALTDKQIAAMRDPRLVGTVKLPTVEDAVKAGGFLAGRPEDIVERLKRSKGAISASTASSARPRSAPPLDVQLADLDRFAKEVIPPSATPARPTPHSGPNGQPPGAASTDNLLQYDLRCFGMVPHVGVGLGFERTLAY